MKINHNNLIINNLTQNKLFENNLKIFLSEWENDAKTLQVQTSGSTGIPKILSIEKEKMLNSAKMTCDFLELKPQNTALLCLPLEYISGKMMVVRALERQLNLFISSPSLNPLEALDFVVDFCAMTPLQVEHSLEKIHYIKKLIIGGAAVSESLKEKLYAQKYPFGTEIYETYGMSETLSHIALKQIYPNSDDYFTTLNKVEISQDERGCLCVSAPLLNDNTLKTNDLVEIRNNKQFKFLGRIDNVINTGGAKVFPEKLEGIVKQYIPNECVFLGVNDESLGQKLILIIEGKENEDLRQKISDIKFEKSFHRPKEIIFIEEIPRTENGKVKRKDLGELLKTLVN